MSYTILPMTNRRKVTLCGTNVYPVPEAHYDRILSEHDLLYIYSGEQPVAQDDETFNLQTGDLILLRAGSHHYGTAPCSVNMRSLFIHFNVIPGDRGEKFLTREEIEAQSGEIILPTVIHCGQDNSVTRTINDIISLYWSHRPNRERRLTLLLNLLLDDLASIAMADESRQEEWSVAVISMFRRYPERMFSLEEIAESVQMNVRTLSARFREITGESVHQYQLNMKLEAAYKALRGGNRTIKDVAMSFGFSDAYYFSRLFKKKFGMSPKQIKRDPSANMGRNPVV